MWPTETCCTQEPTPTTTPTVSPSPSATPSATPTPTCTDVPSTYDAANGGLFIAYEDTGEFTGPTDTGTSVWNATVRDRYNSSDDSRWETRLTTADRTWNSQMYKFNIADVASVTWIEVAWEGYGEHEAEHPVQVRIWNYSAGGWELLDRQYSQSASNDVVLGNRRYELPGINVSKYVNRSATPNELTVFVEGNIHSINGTALATDYVKVVAHRYCPRPAPTFTVDGRKGNFYLWQTYYWQNNAGTWWKRTFTLEIIDRVKETAAYSSGASEPNNTSNVVTNTTHAMWILQAYAPWTNHPRMRRMPVAACGSANYTMCDGEFWYLPNTDAVVAKANQHPAWVNRIMGNGLAPAMVSDTPQAGTDWNAANATMDAPYTVGDNWVMYEYQDADPVAGGDEWVTCSMNYSVVSNLSNWNASNHSANLPNACGKFGSIDDGTQLFNVNVVRSKWVSAPASNNGNTTNGECFWYHNDSVENWVRKYDSMRYYGYEDWGIVAYESEDFGRSNLTVSDRMAGNNLDVSITINNTTGVAQRFNTLLCVYNLSKNTWGQANNIETLNGWCIFPNVTTPTGSWPYIDPALKTTSTLAAGATETITWTDVATLTAGNDYWLWCSGMVYGPWNAR